MIAFKNVDKNFNQKPVLLNMTLKMADEGITCLLGTSGCGKSTALRIAAGLLEPESGEVLIPAGSSGVVFQDPRLLSWLTVKENLSLALPNAKRKNEYKEIEHVLNEVSLNSKEVLNLFPRQLSGGMAQRVGIARALLRGSRYLMLDEPFASLDAMTRADMQSMIKSLIDEHKISALFVTHDMEEAFKIGKRILIMANGAINEELNQQEFATPPAQEKARQLILKHLGKAS